MVRFDSRLVEAGDIFVCLPRGEAFIPDALIRGAKAYILSDRPGLARFANIIYDAPSKRCTVIGITGTNGKTTTSYLVAEGLRQAGFKPFVLGTLNADLTTPESLETLRLMRDHIEQGGTHFVMEVSSHAIDQGRIEGIDFDVKLLTNITQDHLDYHGTFENYRKTKLSFLSAGPSLYPEDYQAVPLPGATSLKGRFNYRNAQAAAAILRHCKVDDSAIVRALAAFKAPPGRFECIEEGQPFLVIVDYAHTPDGLENILQEARHLADERNGRVLTVFGCGGDRDRGKRPKMGAVAQQYSDFFVITQDNPRSEDENQIVDDILAGVSKNYEVIDDRRRAIEKAIGAAGPSDVVVLAGKGHETYQILKSGKIHFDDREVAREAIRKVSS